MSTELPSSDHSEKVQEALHAASWIQTPTLQLAKGRGRHGNSTFTGRLLGGHTSGLESLLVHCSCDACISGGAKEQSVFSLREWFEHAGLDSQDESVANLDALHTTTPKGKLGEWLRTAAVHFGGYGLVGHPLYVYWYGTPRSKRRQQDEQKHGVWYEGVIRGFNPASGEHRVRYKDTSWRAQRVWERESYDMFLPVAHVHFGPDKPRTGYRPSMVRPNGVPPLPNCPLPRAPRRCSRSANTAHTYQNNTQQTTPTLQAPRTHSQSHSRHTPARQLTAATQTQTTSCVMAEEASADMTVPAHHLLRTCPARASKRAATAPLQPAQHARSTKAKKALSTVPQNASTSIYAPLPHTTSTGQAPPPNAAACHHQLEAAPAEALAITQPAAAAAAAAAAPKSMDDATTQVAAAAAAAAAAPKSIMDATPQAAGMTPAAVKTAAQALQRSRPPSGRVCKPSRIVVASMDSREPRKDTLKSVRGAVKENELVGDSAAWVGTEEEATTLQRQLRGKRPKPSQPETETQARAGAAGSQQKQGQQPEGKRLKPKPSQQSRRGSARAPGPQNVDPKLQQQTQNGEANPPQHRPQHVAPQQQDAQQPQSLNTATAMVASLAAALAQLQPQGALTSSALTTHDHTQLPQPQIQAAAAVASLLAALLPLQPQPLHVSLPQHPHMLYPQPPSMPDSQYHHHLCQQCQHHFPPSPPPPQQQQQQQQQQQLLPPLQHALQVLGCAPTLQQAFPAQQSYTAPPPPPPPPQQHHGTCATFAQQPHCTQHSPQLTVPVQMQQHVGQRALLCNTHAAHSPQLAVPVQMQQQIDQLLLQTNAHTAHSPQLIPPLHLQPVPMQSQQQAHTPATSVCQLTALSYLQQASHVLHTASIQAPNHPQRQPDHMLQAASSTLTPTHAAAPLPHEAGVKKPTKQQAGGPAQVPAVRSKAGGRKLAGEQQERRQRCKQLPKRQRTEMGQRPQSRQHAFSLGNQLQMAQGTERQTEHQKREGPCQLQHQGVERLALTRMEKQHEEPLPDGLLCDPFLQGPWAFPEGDVLEMPWVVRV